MNYYNDHKKDLQVNQSIMSNELFTVIERKPLSTLDNNESLNVSNLSDSFQISNDYSIRNIGTINRNERNCENDNDNICEIYRLNSSQLVNEPLEHSTSHISYVDDDVSSFGDSEEENLKKEENNEEEFNEDDDLYFDNDISTLGSYNSLLGYSKGMSKRKSYSSINPKYSGRSRELNDLKDLSKEFSASFVSPRESEQSPFLKDKEKASTEDDEEESSEKAIRVNNNIYRIVNVPYNDKDTNKKCIKRISKIRKSMETEKDYRDSMKEDMMSPLKNEKRENIKLERHISHDRKGSRMDRNDIEGNTVPMYNTLGRYNTEKRVVMLNKGLSQESEYFNREDNDYDNNRRMGGVIGPMKSSVYHPYSQNPLKRNTMLKIASAEYEMKGKKEYNPRTSNFNAQDEIIDREENILRDINQRKSIKDTLFYKNMHYRKSQHRGNHYDPALLKSRTSKGIGEFYTKDKVRFDEEGEPISSRPFSNVYSRKYEGYLDAEGRTKSMDSNNPRLNDHDLENVDASLKTKINPFMLPCTSSHDLNSLEYDQEESISRNCEIFAHPYHTKDSLDGTPGKNEELEKTNNAYLFRNKSVARVTGRTVPMPADGYLRQRSKKSIYPEEEGGGRGQEEEEEENEGIYINCERALNGMNEFIPYGSRRKNRLGEDMIGQKHKNNNMYYRNMEDSPRYKTNAGYMDYDQYPLDHEMEKRHSFGRIGNAGPLMNHPNMQDDEMNEFYYVNERERRMNGYDLEGSDGHLGIYRNDMYVEDGYSSGMLRRRPSTIEGYKKGDEYPYDNIHDVRTNEEEYYYPYENQNSQDRYYTKYNSKREISSRKNYLNDDRTQLLRSREHSFGHGVRDENPMDTFENVEKMNECDEKETKHTHVEKEESGRKSVKKQTDEEEKETEKKNEDITKSNEKEVINESNNKNNNVPLETSKETQNAEEAIKGKEVTQDINKEDTSKVDVGNENNQNIIPSNNILQTQETTSTTTGGVSTTGITLETKQGTSTVASTVPQTQVPPPATTVTNTTITNTNGTLLPQPSQVVQAPVKRRRGRPKKNQDESQTNAINQNLINAQNQLNNLVYQQTLNTNGMNNLPNPTVMNHHVNKMIPDINQPLYGNINAQTQASFNNALAMNAHMNQLNQINQIIDSQMNQNVDNQLTQPLNHQINALNQMMPINPHLNHQLTQPVNQHLEQPLNMNRNMNQQFGHQMYNNLNPQMNQPMYVVQNRIEDGMEEMYQAYNNNNTNTNTNGNIEYDKEVTNVLEQEYYYNKENINDVPNNEDHYPFDDNEINRNNKRTVRDSFNNSEERERESSDRESKKVHKKRGRKKKRYTEDTTNNDNDTNSVDNRNSVDNEKNNTNHAGSDDSKNDDKSEGISTFIGDNNKTITYKVPYRFKDTEWETVSGIKLGSMILTTQCRTMNVILSKKRSIELGNILEHSIYGYIYKGDNVRLTIGNESKSIKSGSPFFLPSFNDCSIHNDDEVKSARLFLCFLYLT